MKDALLTRLLVLIALVVMISPIQAIGQGNNRSGKKPTKVELGSIVPFATENGLVSLSVDGLGSNAASGIITVQKPAGATVRSAYMAAASTGFSGRILANGDVKINGTNVVWNVIASTPSSIASSNSLADVTSIVAPIVNAAPAGPVDLTITEVNTLGIDGELLAVIFDDPTQTSVNTIILLFGAQAIAGDDFHIGLAEPLDLTNPDLKLDLGLGISFSFQVPPGNVNQISRVDVNGTRMSSAAGGQDDSDLYPGANGSLMTVGGLGDTNGNPPPLSPPLSGANNPDDELYNLIPFVTQGATAINVHTINPSNDDNIFFASLFLGGTTAVVGEGILLAPVMAENNVGTQHTVTATVQNNNGDPIANRLVNFDIISGPHVGGTGSGTTNASGQTSFTYTGTNPGIDIIKARMINTQGQPDTSNEARKVWRVVQQQDTDPPSCQITGTIPGPPKQIIVTIQDAQSGLASIVPVTVINATLNIPGFTVGTNDPVVVTATKIDQSIASTVVLRATDVSENVTVCDPVYTTLSGDVPQEFMLASNYPNPFNPTTSINFGISRAFTGGLVSLKIYNLLGQEIKTLINEPMQPGEYSVQWDATNNSGERVQSGVYVYRLIAGDFAATKKMTLLK